MKAYVPNDYAPVDLTIAKTQMEGVGLLNNGTTDGVIACETLRGIDNNGNKVKRLFTVFAGEHFPVAVTAVYGTSGGTTATAVSVGIE
jgi:hypothetical protein